MCMIPTNDGNTIHVVSTEEPNAVDLSKLLNMSQSRIYLNSGKIDKKSKIVCSDNFIASSHKAKKSSADPLKKSKLYQ